MYYSYRPPRQSLKLNFKKDTSYKIQVFIQCDEMNPSWQCTYINGEKKGIKNELEKINTNVICEVLYFCCAFSKRNNFQVQPFCHAHEYIYTYSLNFIVALTMTYTFARYMNFLLPLAMKLLFLRIFFILSVCMHVYIK